MKKISRIAALFVAGAFLLSSCVQESLDTNPFSETEVVLASYGPNPVARGAALRIIGSNLENVKSVSVPGIDPITSIEVVTKGVHSEIRVQLPKDGPEVGRITLVTSGGKTITSATDLTYSEPVIFTSFAPASAMPGDVITVDGDYMNLIREVVFSNGVYVGDEDIEHVSRYQLKVKVPSCAITGKIILGDQDETVSTELANLYYSADELAIGDPTTVKNEKATYKAGDEITFKGSFLDMIASIEIGEVSVTNFAVSSDGKSISFALPEAATDGTIYAVSFAGKKFEVGEIETVIPTSLEAAPSPVKAGKMLTITGKDLDLVSQIDFDGASDTEFECVDGKITLMVPDTAKEGDITLSLANGKQVTTPFTLVKPVISGFDVTEIVAGSTFTISGTDLDLATKVTLGGKEESFVFAQDGSAIRLTTAVTSVSGKVVITTANGTEITSEDEMKVTYESFIIVNEMPSAAHIGATVTFKGENFMMIDRIYIGETKVTDYITRTANELAFVMPYNKIGTYQIKFELQSGDVEICPTPIEVLLEQKITTAWEGNVDITWGDGGRVAVPYSAFSGVKAGSSMRFYYSQKDQVWAQAQVNNGSWAPINFDGAKGTQFNGTLVPTDVYGWTFADRITEVELTSSILDNINASHGDYGGLDAAIIIQGSDLIFTKVEIVQEIAQEKTLWEGTADLGAWSVNWQVGDGTFGATNPNMFTQAGLAVGQEVRIYCTAADWWQIQFFDGHWGAQSEIGTATGLGNGNNINSGIYTMKDGYIAIPVTETLQSQLTTLTDWGYCWIIQGEGLVINKITVF